MPAPEINFLEALHAPTVLGDGTVIEGRDPNISPMNEQIDAFLSEREASIRPESFSGEPTPSIPARRAS